MNGTPGSLPLLLVKLRQSWTRLFDSAGTQSPTGDPKNRRSWLGVELLLAVSLSAAYYFLVRGYAAGVQNNSTNYWVFTSCSLSNFHLGQLYEVWKGRLAGLLLSGSLFDALVQQNHVNPERYASVFALYQAAWLFLLFLLVIYAARNSMIVNLGIFAGLMYNFSPAAGLYFYPWDIPAAFFFTLAILLFQRGEVLWAAAATCVGCFFKETVLVAALLPLFATRWRWVSRVALFLAVLAVYVWGKKLLLGWLRTEVAVFSMGDATNVKELFRWQFALDNVRTLFSPGLNHVLFANGGTLAAVLVLGWQRRFHPYLLLILAFLAGNFFYGAFSEFRIFIQVLPLSWLILAERWTSRSETSPAPEASAWAVRGTAGGLVLAGLLICAAVPAVLARPYYALAESRTPAAQARALTTLQGRAQAGDAAAQAELGMRLLRGEGFPADATQAVTWLRRAAEQGEPRAQCELGVLYAQGGTLPQDYAAAFSWLQKSALQGDSEGQYGLACFYEKGLGVPKEPLEAALWYQRAAEQGNVRAQLNLGLLLCIVRQEYAQATVWLRKAAEQGNPEAQLALGKLSRGVPGVTPDSVEAFKWLKLAQLQGAPGADKQLDDCLLSMSPEQVAAGEMQVRLKLQKSR